MRADDYSNADARYKWQDDKENTRSCEPFKQRHTRPKEQQTQARLRQTQASLPLFELARVLVRLDHVASVIINVNYDIVRVSGRANR